MSRSAYLQERVSSTCSLWTQPSAWHITVTECSDSPCSLQKKQQEAREVHPVVLTGRKGQNWQVKCRLAQVGCYKSSFLYDLKSRALCCTTTVLLLLRQDLLGCVWAHSWCRWREKNVERPSRLGWQKPGGTSVDENEEDGMQGYEIWVGFSVSYFRGVWLRGCQLLCLCWERSHLGVSVLGKAIIWILWVWPWLHHCDAQYQLKLRSSREARTRM